jgi:Protein of unknown function (DUF2845)
MATDLIRVATTAVAATLVLLVAAPARADSMRCGSRLVSDGDPIEKVLQHCGEPDYTQRYYIVRAPRFKLGNREFAFPGEEEVPVDLWTYDFGPNQLMRRLRFVAGELKSIETLDYGSR